MELGERETTDKPPSDKPTDPLSKALARGFLVQGHPVGRIVVVRLGRTETRRGPAWLWVNNGIPFWGR